MNEELFLCQCSSCEHQMIIRSVEDDDLGTMVFAEIYLPTQSFWHRLLYGLKYIFGHKCCYGAFEEIILKPSDAEKLEKVVAILKSQQRKVDVP